MVSWNTKKRNDNVMNIKALSDDAMICFCKKVTKKEIEDALKNGATNLKEVSLATGACGSSEYCVQMNPNMRCCAIDIIETIKLYKEDK